MVGRVRAPVRAVDRVAGSIGRFGERGRRAVVWLPRRRGRSLSGQCRSLRQLFGDCDGATDGSILYREDHVLRYHDAGRGSYRRRGPRGFFRGDGADAAAANWIAWRSISFDSRCPVCWDGWRPASTCITAATIMSWCAMSACYRRYQAIRARNEPNFAFKNLYSAHGERSYNLRPSRPPSHSEAARARHLDRRRRLLAINEARPELRDLRAIIDKHHRIKADNLASV